ncbi:MAG: VanZ family protein [Candidatus Nanoarchaeia archaeon]|nr:VanZ family protein [Candidatus Nanoarchaeia archaeon]
MISWLEKNKLVPFGITAFLFFAIFYVSGFSFPVSTTGVGPSGPLATIYHISIFFLLAIFLFISCLERKLEFRKIIPSILLVTIYAILDEVHQYFVPGRVCSLSDFFLDFTGIAFAVLIYFILIFLKTKSSGNSKKHANF